MSRPGYKTKSDTMLLRRLINNLKERGSEVAGELERKAHNFLTDVQIKRKKKPEQTFESDDESGSDWEDFPDPPDPPTVKLVIPPPLLLPILEPLRTRTPSPKTPPPSPRIPEVVSLPTPPPISVMPSFIPVLEVAPPPPKEPTPEPEPKPVKKPKSPLPNRQQIRSLTKDTPSMSADKPKLTPDCKLYWIQKHLEQEKQEEEERAQKRKMSIASFCSGISEVSTEDEENRLREEEARRIEEERKLREEAERLRALQEKMKEEERIKAENELKRKQEEMRRKVEGENKRKAAEDAKRMAAELELKRKAEEEEAKHRAAEEVTRRKAAEEEAKRRLAEEEQRLASEQEASRKAAEEKEKLKIDEDLARTLKEQLVLEEAEKAKMEEFVTKEQKKKMKVSGQRSKKPTMAREWRKLKEKQKQDVPKELTVEKMDIDTTPEVSPLPTRAKYVPPVFKENESYTDRHNSFLKGAWPHNNKKGIPTPSELAEAGFFFIGPGDYCRCYQCGLEQMCWEPFESPWVRHGFLAPECCYVERIKGREWVEGVLKGEF